MATFVFLISFLNVGMVTGAPNILFVLADDMGQITKCDWLACHGEFEVENLIFSGQLVLMVTLR